MSANLCVEDYEIGNQKNFDFLEIYQLLLDKNEEEEEDYKFKNELKEYHHSLFYPILVYCINTLNSYDNEKLIKNKLNIGVDNKNRIYVSVNRMMYDLFFTEMEGSIDGQTINFNSGKNDFDLKPIYDNNKKTANENYKIYFEIDKYSANISAKEKIDKMSKELNLTIEQLIQNKKKNIVSRFLKGYSHQEGILKSFEAKIKGQFKYMPNLIFQKANFDGKTIEEIDQIYLLNLKEGKKQINDFDVFYYADYSKKPVEYKVINDGMPLELESNNLYFIEIKKSSRGLNESYQKVKDIILEVNSKSKSSKFKRKDLTDLGNSILTVNNFAKLIREITKKEYILNLLYIADDDYNLDMVQIFNDCLKHDEKVIEKQYTFKLKLIYTQPDLFMKNFIEENNIKNKEIKTLEEIIKECKSTIEKNKENSKILENKFRNSYKFVDVNAEVIDFCKRIVNTKSLMTVGIKEIINTNHPYKFTCLKSVSSFLENNLRKNYYLIDLATFNCVKFQELNNQYLFDISIEDYKEDISLCENFEDAYLLVDYAFMSNFSNIINENILQNYAINIYMFEGEYFIIYLKRDSSIIQSEIKFYKNKCLNPMLEETSGNMSVKEVEEFVNNYYNLLSLRDFFRKNETESKKDELYLFDFKGRINYIINLCIKPNENKIKLNDKENKSKKSDWNIEILSVKTEFNKYHDYLGNEFIENFGSKNLIFLRKTEFGMSFSQKRIESIIKYLFKINNEINIVNRLNIVNKFDIIKGDKYGDNTIIKILNNNNTLPILINSNNEIELKNITLIEYEFFLSMPLLLGKKYNENKPEILILSNDYGLLNYYYNYLYRNILNIESFSESKYKIEEQDFFKINNDNIKIKDFFEVVNDKKKEKNSNINNYDLILLESFDKRNENDSTIPNKDLLTIFIDILNCNGIFAFNLRYETYNDNSIIISKLKKIYKKVIEIELRIGSKFFICCPDKNIKMINYYKPNDNIIDKLILDEIEQNLNK